MKIIKLILTLSLLAVFATPAQNVYHRRAAFRSSSFTYYATVFDGSADYLTRGADLTGNADGQTGLFSVWYKSNTDATDCRFISFSTGGVCYIRKDTSDRVQVYMENSSGTTILSMVSTTDSIEAADGWVHILASWDLGTAGRRHVYINDAADTTVGTFTNDTIDYAGGSNVTVGSWVTGASKLDGEVSELYFAQEWLDISVEANRRKFISAGGLPVDLGADGSTPTGTQPIIYLPNPYTTFEQNAGSGGDFTVTGALTEGTPPT